MVNGVFTISLPASAWASTDSPTAAARSAASGSANNDAASAIDASQAGAPVGGGEFIAGPENRLAGLAIHAIVHRTIPQLPAHEAAQNDAAQNDRDALAPGEPTTFDGPLAFDGPLVFYGPTGSGKSHLARGLAVWWQRHHGEPHHATRGALCLSGAEYAQQYAAAVEAGKVDAWRKRCRRPSLLVLEDIGQLAGKSAAQRELWHTLDALAQFGALVVVTARSLPSQSPNLLAALRSRLSAGLSVPLALPGVGARRAIVERIAAARGLDLPKRAAETLADGLALSAPALLGALVELEMLAGQERGQLSAERIRRYVASYGRGEPLTIRAIALLTAKYFRLKLADLKSASRRQSLVTARGVAIHLARQLSDLSLDQIGDYFGGRDHTTVLNSLRRTEDLIRRDPAIRQAATDLKRTLLAP